jgi:hypothetical protein
MTIDRRGFEYALEPVRTYTDWDITNASLDLARQNNLVNAQHRIVNQLSDSLHIVQSRVTAQRQTHSLIDISAQRLAHAYMVQLQTSIAKENATLEKIKTERDEIELKLSSLRKFAESLNQDRKTALAAHDLSVNKLVMQVADDNWLQQHRRNAF